MIRPQFFSTPTAGSTSAVHSSYRGPAIISLVVLRGPLWSPCKLTTFATLDERRAPAGRMSREPGLTNERVSDPFLSCKYSHMINRYWSVSCHVMRAASGWSLAEMGFDWPASYLTPGSYWLKSCVLIG